MRAIDASDVDKVSGGWNPVAIVLGAIAVYDAVTDFAKGVQEGYDETAIPPSSNP